MGENKRGIGAVVRTRSELRHMKQSPKGLGGKMIGILIKMIWMRGAKGKEGFLFETNQPVCCSPSSQNPHPNKQIKKTSNQNKRTAVVERAEWVEKHSRLEAI